MGLLNNLFGSTEDLAKATRANADLIFRQWIEYLETISDKRHIILSLNEDNPFKPDLQKLMSLLITDLNDISKEEKEESALIRDLEALKHSEKIRRVHRLEDCLSYEATKYEYIHQLLQQLHSCLVNETDIAKKLLNGSEPVQLVAHLRYQLTLELAIIQKIQKAKTFKDLFLALVKGEHVIRSMDSREKRLITKMQKGMTGVFREEITAGITFEWINLVFRMIQDKVHEGVATGMLEHHANVDFEFVNRPEFIVLVKNVIQSIRKKPVSEQMINAFAHLFREWFN